MYYHFPMYHNYIVITSISRVYKQKENNSTYNNNIMVPIFYIGIVDTYKITY